LLMVIKGRILNRIGAKSPLWPHARVHTRQNECDWRALVTITGL
jgi:hypothetical protein